MKENELECPFCKKKFIGANKQHANAQLTSHVLFKHDEPNKKLEESGWLVSLSSAELISEDVDDLLKKINSSSELSTALRGELQLTLKEIRKKADAIAGELEAARNEKLPRITRNTGRTKSQAPKQSE